VDGDGRRQPDPETTVASVRGGDGGHLTILAPGGGAILAALDLEGERVFNPRPLHPRLQTDMSDGSPFTSTYRVQPPPPERHEGPQDTVLRASKRRIELPSVHPRCVAPGCVPGGGLFQVNCSRVGTRCLLGTSALLGSVPTPLGDVAPDPVLQHRVGVATDPTAALCAESVHAGGHSTVQLRRPALTASLIRSPSATPRTRASPA
jgi:hypothetical protein